MVLQMIGKAWRTLPQLWPAARHMAGGKTYGWWLDNGAPDTGARLTVVEMPKIRCNMSG
jgi:hypothetical protein